MAICGDFKTMPLVELLQWAGGNRKTGVLDIERNKIRKSIAFRDGRIVGCKSSDPTALIGHFLISRGKITERTLRYAMKQREATDVRLSDVFVEMGVLSEEEVTEAYKANALETIYGLFEWERAVFRFQSDATLDQQLGIELSVEATLLNGAEREDDLQRIRAVFTSSGVVLTRTDQPLPARLDGGDIAFPVLNLVDGRRTVAEIVLQAHASEFQVLKLLFSLHDNGNVKIADERPVQGGTTTLIDVRNDDETVQLPSLEELFEGSAEQKTDRDGATAERDAPRETATEQPQESRASASSLESDDLGTLLQFAADRLDLGDHEGALTMLDTCYRARPDDESVKRLMEAAESSYLEKVGKYLLPPDRIPSREISSDELSATTLEPMEASIFDMIDGQTNVQSLVWTAPLREVQVMRTLHKLHEQGLIRLDAPTTAAVGGGT